MTARTPRPNPWRAPRQGGLTLIELMIAMVLGLIVVGGAVSVIIANRQTHRTNEAFSQIQESSRTAFELLVRDIRQAGSTGCGNTDRIGNVLNAGTGWWQNWSGVQGYDGATAAPAVGFGTATGTRVAGTDAIMVQGLEDTGLYVVSHSTGSGGGAANFQINTPTRDFVDGDVLIVCDFDHATIFQISNYNSSNTTTVFNVGGSISPGNCSKGLGFPTICTTNGNMYEFKENSTIGRMTAVTWYIGNNGRAAEGGRSLYRIRLGDGGVGVTEEIVAGVVDMQLMFRQGTTAALLGAPTNWDLVNAVEVSLTMDSADRNVSVDSATNSGRLRRTFTNLVGLRNRIE